MRVHRNENKMIIESEKGKALGFRKYTDKENEMLNGHITKIEVVCKEDFNVSPEIYEYGNFEDLIAEPDNSQVSDNVKNELENL